MYFRVESDIELIITLISPVIGNNCLVDDFLIFVTEWENVVYYDGKQWIKNIFFH